MVAYTMIRMLFEYEYAIKHDKEIEKMNGTTILNLLSCHDVYVLPVVNIDGFFVLSDNWSDKN